MNLPFALPFDGLQFQRPLWLLGLLALPLLAWAWRARARRRSVWRELVDPHLLPHLLQGAGATRARWPWLALALLALACIALSGPGWRRVDQPLWQTRAPLVIALDLSNQTLANDLPPSRLAQARAKIATLLRERKGGQVALVAYADDAFTVSPLTDDVDNIALFLDALRPEVMPVDGDRPARAIAWSARLLRQAGFEQGDIVLMTGGVDRAANAAASRASEDGYRVSVLGLGTAAGGRYRRDDGSLAQTRLDAGSLQALARAGGGQYAALQPGQADLQALGVLDPARTGGGLAARGQKAATWLDEGYWLLPPLVLLAAFAFRRGAVFAVLLLALALPAPALRAQASAAQAQPARAPGGGTLWRRADQQDHTRMQRGEQAYRKGDFAAAAQAFGSLDSADAAYNAGNALARQARYQDAIAAYDRALKQQPGMPDAVANRAAVEAAMKRKPPQGGNQDKPNPQSSQKGQSQSRPQGQGEPTKPEGKPQPPQQGNPSKSPQGAAKTEPQGRQANDPARQRAADEAQRERMQRALDAQRRADRGQEVEGQPDRAEQAARRERSQATEAWLRRVPDDPGALLRAKFEREQQRRQALGED